MAFWNRKRKKRKQERETEQTEEIMQDTSVEDKDTEEIPAGVATQEQYKTEVIKPVYKKQCQPACRTKRACTLQR